MIEKLKLGAQAARLQVLKQASGLRSQKSIPDFRLPFSDMLAPRSPLLASLFTALALLVPGLTRATVRPNPLFSDHMVLQTGVPIPVWGIAAPGERVTVTLAGQTQTAVTELYGRWKVQFAPLTKNEALEITLTGADGKPIVVRDVLVGEVWFCSGQSNMDMRVARGDRYWCGVNNEKEEVASANYPNIRMFYAEFQMTDIPQAEVKGKWVICSPETVGDFSATAYFFARELYKTHPFPIGLVVSTYGASTAEAWISREALDVKPELKFLSDAYMQKKIRFDGQGDAKQKYEQAMKAWNIAAAQAKAEGKDKPKGPKNPDPGQDQHNPSVLYHGMIAPLVPYAIRGTLWYQGESNYGTGDKYFTLMETLIRDWRQRWGEGDTPFIFVQLANNKKLATDPNAKSEMAPVREGQLQTLQLPHISMAVAIDIGDADNIHPKNKQEIGRRLSLIARAQVYGESIPYSGPLFDSVTTENGSLRIKFKHTAGGLTVHGDKLTGFAIAGADGKFVWADARIDRDSVVVSSAAVPAPQNVRYGWADNPPVNLYNSAGLPASPFRSEVK